MLKHALALLLLATPLQAQDFGLLGGSRDLTFDMGVGASYRPVYPGADSNDVAPWLILRNGNRGDAGAGDAQGFSFLPSLRMIGERDESDDASLAGMGDIDRAYEVGGSVRYGIGPVTAYGTLRKGFGGHDGLTGEVGLRHRLDVSDRLTLWSSLFAGYGDSDYSQTYFGISPEQAANSGRAEYSPGGGINSAVARLEARYALTDSIALLGELQYGRLVGDAGDSPIVQDKDQPIVRLGVVRRFSFGF